MPLLLNETLWAAGMAMLSQCYSVRGLNVIAAQNISNTIGNVFNIVFIALGDSVAIFHEDKPDDTLNDITNLHENKDCCDRKRRKTA